MNARKVQEIHAPLMHSVSDAQVKKCPTGNRTKAGVEKQSLELRIPTNIVAVDISGKNSFLRAVARTNAAEFHQLLAQSDLNFKDYSGRNALMHAAMVGNDGIVRSLLGDKRVLEIDCQDMAGFTALMHAAQRGHESIVEQLLSVGAKHELCSELGNTAIILAARRNQVGCLRTLARFIRSPADWRARGECGLTAEQWAEENGRVQAAEFVRMTLSKLDTQHKAKVSDDLPGDGGGSGGGDNGFGGNGFAKGASVGRVLRQCSSRSGATYRGGPGGVGSGKRRRQSTSDADETPPRRRCQRQPQIKSTTTGGINGHGGGHGSSVGGGGGGGGGNGVDGVGGGGAVGIGPIGGGAGGGGGNNGGGLGPNGLPTWEQDFHEPSLLRSLRNLVTTSEDRYDIGDSREAYLVSFQRVNRGCDQLLIFHEFSAKDPIVKNFWRVLTSLGFTVHNLDTENQAALLQYIDNDMRVEISQDCSAWTMALMDFGYLDHQQKVDLLNSPVHLAAGVPKLLLNQGVAPSSERYVTRLNHPDCLYVYSHQDGDSASSGFSEKLQKIFSALTKPEITKGMKTLTRLADGSVFDNFLGRQLHFPGN